MHRVLTALFTIAALVTSVLVNPATEAHAATGGRDYFVDCQAHAAGSGSRTSPWRSLTSIEADAVLLPGDRILLKRGSKCRGRLTLTTSGTAAHPLTLGAYGSGARPVLHGAGTPDGTGTVQVIDAEHWIIRDLRVTNRATGTRASEHRAGVLVRNVSEGRLSGIVIQDLRVDHVTSYPWSTLGVFAHGYGGIALVTDSRAPGAGYDHVRIMRNRVDHVGRSGIITWNHQGQANTSWDRDVRISGNTVLWAMGDSILLGGALRSRIDHNIAAHGVNLPPCPMSICPDTKATASAGIWPIFSRTLRIDHNEAYGMRWGPGDGEGFDLDASTTDVLFEYNYAHDNQGGGLLLCGSRNVIVRFNIFQNNQKSALVFIGTMPAIDTRIYNNTLYSSARSKARPVRSFNGPYKTDITFANNLVYNYGRSGWLWPTRPRTAANTVIGGRGDGGPEDRLTYLRNPGLRAAGTGRNGFNSLLGYKPRHPSTFSRGVAIPKTVTRDFFGKKIDPARPPRGAAG